MSKSRKSQNEESVPGRGNKPGSSKQKQTRKVEQGTAGGAKRASATPVRSEREHECDCTETEARARDISGGAAPSNDDLRRALMERVESDPFMAALLGAVREMDAKEARTKLKRKSAAAR